MLFVYWQPPEELASELLAVQCAFVVAKNGTMEGSITGCK